MPWSAIFTGIGELGCLRTHLPCGLAGRLHDLHRLFHRVCSSKLSPDLILWPAGEMSICLHLRRCPCFGDLWSLGHLGLHLATSSLTRWPPVLVRWRSEHANLIIGDYTSPPTSFPSANLASHQHAYTVAWCHVITSDYQGGTVST